MRSVDWMVGLSPKHFLIEPTPIFYYSADLTAKVSMTATFCSAGAFQG